MTSEKEWKEKLTPEVFHILREKGTEKAFSGKLLENKEKGIYVCAGCGYELFSSERKYDSGSGWPSFTDVVNSGNVELKDDVSLGIRRVEVVCKKCGGHLGHVFDDGPRDKGGKRYCVNSSSLKFNPS